jgi:hypothetical protein
LGESRAQLYSVAFGKTIYLTFISLDSRATTWVWLGNIKPVSLLSVSFSAFITDGYSSTSFRLFLVAHDRFCFSK